MLKFEATYYDGIHPVGEPVTVLVTANGKTNFVGQKVSYTCDWRDIKVSTQLGKTARSLSLPNGAKCESDAHMQINCLQENDKLSRLGKLLHTLESRWHYVLIASVAVVAVVFGMITYGIPALAKQVAFALPATVDAKLSEGTLTFFDKHILAPSELDAEHQQRLQEKFATIVARSNDNHDYTLLFRRGIGPNAFALPSGHIIMTDELVELAEQDDEVLAVLAHEIGHVVHKHGLRSALQSSAVALLLTAVTGDISAASGLAAALPIILLETSYSRKFEHEADQYAFDYMQAHGIDTKHFASILHKITGDGENESKSAFTYLSTHPITAERTRRFIEGSKSR